MKRRAMAWLPAASDRRAARQGLWMGGITAVQLVGALAHAAIAARLLGPEGFGALAVVAAVAAVIHALFSMPGGETIAAFATRAIALGRPGEAARIVRFALAASFGMSLAAFAAIAALALAAESLAGVGFAGETLKAAAPYTDALLLYGLAGVLTAGQSESMATSVASNG